MYKNQHRWIQLMLMLLDGLLAIAAILIAGIMRYGTLKLFFSTINLAEIVLIAFISGFVAFSVANLYLGIFRRGYLRELQRVSIYSFYIMLFLSLYSFSTKNNFMLSRLTLLYFFFANITLVYLFHLLLKVLIKRRTHGQHGWKLLILTDSANAETVGRNIQESEWKDRTVGMLLLDKQPAEPFTLSGIPILQPGMEIIDYITQNAVDEVLVSVSISRHKTAAVKTLLKQIADAGIILSVKLWVPLDESRQVSKMTQFGDSYVISIADREYDYFMILVKRGMDILSGLAGLLITAVAFPFLAVAIRLESPGPLLFRQKRVGRNGRIFTMYKFRSMYADAEARKAALMEHNKMQGPLFKINDDPRITRVGKFIRKTSLDELPQFYNIFKGDMSLVGTRPPTLDEYKQYTSDQKRRLSFRPGLTGLWQVSGRSDITDFDEVMKMDLQYIREWSVYLDIKVILQTVLAVLFRKGAQ
jgi:exopolysaccharide biosynthesis polyprenyl glycosylphosphotransferase